MPELPGHRAGAEPDERDQPEHPPRRHRRRAVPGRSRAAPDHVGADGAAQRPAVRPGPHDHRTDHGQARHRRIDARCREDQGQGRVRRSGDRRRSGRRRGGDLRRAQGHPHRRGGRAFRRPGAGHDGDRELHLGHLHRRPEARHRAGTARARVRRRHHEPAAREQADPGERAGRPDRSAAGKRRVAEVAQRRPVDRCTLAPDERAGRAGIQEQGRGLLPALRRPAVQGQARGGDRRRQLGRRGGDRPGGHRLARDADRVRRAAACRRSAAAQAAFAEERGRDRQRTDDRSARRRPEGHGPGLQGPHRRRRAPHRSGRRVRANRPAAQHRMAEGRGGAVAAWRDRSRFARPHLGPGRVRRRRCHDHAVQADRDRDGRRLEGGAERVRPLDPHQRTGAGDDRRRGLLSPALPLLAGEGRGGRCSTSMQHHARDTP